MSTYAVRLFYVSLLFPSQLNISRDAPNPTDFRLVFDKPKHSKTLEANLFSEPMYTPKWFYKYEIMNFDLPLPLSEQRNTTCRY